MGYSRRTAFFGREEAPRLDILRRERKGQVQEISPCSSTLRWCADHIGGRNGTPRATMHPCAETLAGGRLAARTRKKQDSYHLPQCSISLPSRVRPGGVDAPKEDRQTDRLADRLAETHRLQKATHKFAVLLCLPPCVACGRDLSARDKQNDAVRCRRYGLCAAIVRGAPS